MSAKNVLNKIRTALQMEVKLETMELTDGTVIEAEVFEVDAEVFVMSGENRVALPVGEYMIADGNVLIVLQEGIIAEIKPADAPAEEPAAAPEVVAEEPQLETAPKKIIESVSREEFFAEIQKLTAHFTEVLEETKKLNLKQEEAEPTEKVVHSPEKEVTKKLDFKTPNKTASRKQQIIAKLNK